MACEIREALAEPSVVKTVVLHGFFLGVGCAVVDQVEPRCPSRIGIGIVIYAASE